MRIHLNEDTLYLPHAGQGSPVGRARLGHRRTTPSWIHERRSLRSGTFGYFRGDSTYDTTRTCKGLVESGHLWRSPLLWAIPARPWWLILRTLCSSSWSGSDIHVQDPSMVTLNVSELTSTIFVILVKISFVFKKTWQRC